MEKKSSQWNNESMQQAIDSYEKKIYGFNECCRRFGIPKPTFRRHLKDMIKRPLSSAKKTDALRTLSNDVEDELVQHLLNLEAVFFGLNITDVRRLAFQIAEQNCISHRFNRNTKMAGKKWFYSFMKKHTRLSLRLPENTSMARVKGFNREAVYRFFDILQEISRTNGIDATTIFNVDESGFSTVQKKCSKIIGRKGKKRIGRVISEERGTNTTVVCCASASGTYVPPMFIFKRKRMASHLGYGAPAGSLIEIADHGFITSELFVKWLQHFIDFIKPTTNKKVLLLLDGHTTHSKNLDALELARVNRVILLQLPGHTTHRLQPLDVCIFGPMQIYYDQALDQWMSNNVGQCITQFDVAPIIATAYYKAASVGNAVNAFKSTGCWPINRFVFNDDDFVASDLLNKENENDENENDENGNNENDLEVPEKNIPEKNSNEMVEHNSLQVPVTEISQLPVPSTSTKKRRRAAQGAVVLTSSPYKNVIAASKEKKSTKTDKIKKVKRNFQELNHSAEDVTISVQEEDWFCFLCMEAQIEDMIQCIECKVWVHESCAGVLKKEKVYFCPKCKLY